MKITIYFLLTLLVFIIYCSRNTDKRDKNESFFVVYDSLSLNYPDSLFPKKILDIVYQNDYIYVLNGDRKMEYPLVKFTKDGKFIKAVGRKGGGPKEYKYPIQKICANDDYIALFTIGVNSLWILKDDKIVKHKNIDMKLKVTGITFIDNDNLLLSTFGDSPKHIVILDSSLNIVEKLQDMPENAELITHGGSYVFIDGLFKRNNKYYTQLGYPYIIYETEKINGKYSVKPIIKDLKLDNLYGKKPEKLKNDLDNNNIPLGEYMNSLNPIYKIYVEDDYVAGIFMGFDKKEQKQGVYLFLAKGGKKIVERKGTFERLGGMIPYDDGMAQAHFYKENGNLKVKLYFIHLNRKLIASKEN